MKILVVEDEPAIVYMLRYNLEKQGYQVIDTEKGGDVIELATAQKPDLILLDWRLADNVDGVDVCYALRKNQRLHQIPIIMLTARAQDGDKVKALGTGADDYMTKPFSIVELLARIKAVLRRAAPMAAGETLKFADLDMDMAQCKVFRSGKPIHLGPTEFRLLHFFMRHPRKVFGRDELLSQVWGDNIHVEDRTVDVHIRRLRRSLGDPDIIRTVRKTGYALDDSAG
ncbi:MAG: winged helix-turn-helix domain-containing protein [Alphaproteobacteria bacterium]|nr:winged helix-turn-helix domain-containing protein [Alphaproteobacteria bacterium]